jgi:hypothetical protein
LGELTVTGSSSVSPDVAMFVGDFAGAQRRTKFVLKVMRGADAVWRVSGFDVTE